MLTRTLRLLPFLFVSSLGPLVLAQSADLSVTITLPSTTVYQGDAAEMNGQVTITNAGPSIAQGVVVDFDSSMSTLVVASPFDCAKTNGHFRCTAISMAPGSVSGGFLAQWLQAPNGTVESVTATVASASPADPNTANNSASAKTTVVYQASLDVGPFGVPSSTAPGAVVEVGEFYGNRGPSPAIDFKLTISLPPGTIYDHYSADPATLKCTGPAKGGQGDLVCTTPTVFVGSFYSVTAVVRVDPAAASGTVLTFPASVAASNASSQTSSASLTVLPSADLRVAVSAPSTVVGGNQFLNAITVTNDGPASAVDAEVHYVQPGGPNSYEPMTAPPGWVCNQAICTNSSFAPGTATFTIAVPIPLALKSGTITGEVLVLSANDPTSANNTAFAATTIIAAPQATLQLSLTATPDVVNSGDQLTYTARIANTSNADAQTVNLQWMMPATVIATTCGTESKSVCTFPTIAAGTTQTATWTVRVAAGAGTLLTARTTIDGPNIVYDPQLLSATLTTTVAGTPHVDLEPAITVPQAVRAGENAVWIYSVQNHGPDPATDWQLTLPLPPNTYLTTGSVKWGTGTCSGLTPNAANAQVTCHGTYLAANSDFELDLLLTVIPGTTAPINATATVSTANADSDPKNDTAVAVAPITTTIITSAAITESITPDKTAAVMGERVTQTFTLTGYGPDAATGVALDVYVPAGSSFVTVSSTFASCTGTAPIHCVAPTLASGAALTASVSFNAPQQTGTFRTDGYTEWDNDGATKGFTRAFTNLQVIAPPPGSDVTVALDATPNTLDTGDTVTYTIAARNIGASAASNVTVQLDLPPSLAFVSASPQCSGGQKVTCTAGTLNSNTAATFTVTARAVEAGTIKATASVSTTSEESNNGNNTAAATITVNAPAAPVRRRAARH